MIAFLALGAFEFQTIDPAKIEAVGAQADQEQREANNQHDWWLVSTSGYGIVQSRFYIDRIEMTSMEPVSRAWTDRYAIERGLLIHDKVLIVAQCDDRNPQIQFRTFIAYRPDAAPETNSDSTWRDVVPGSSQQTLWRFICHSAPANAIVFVPDGPESDARRYFAEARRRGKKKG